MVPDPRDDAGHPFSDRALVLNPVSGSEDHAARIRRLATDHGFSIHETERTGDAVDIAAAAVEGGATLLAVAGGDGTLNEALRGLDAADAVGEVTFAAVPAGTGNNFARNVGIEGIEHAFEVIERGRRRQIDLGTASVDGGDPLPFLNSCVGGITAEASADTTPHSKSRLGVVAYVLNTIQTVTDFDPLRMHADIEGAEGRDGWTGDAAAILVGNGRRFPGDGRTQADMEDGLLDVTILEHESTANLAAETFRSWLAADETEHLTRVQATSMTLNLFGEEAIQFSLDGEMVAAHRLDVEVRPGVLDLLVGEAYEPSPEGG